jgi:tRNA threonylcarbamoyl adenosine modification protein (Sua5/YciO/YrdC/YwlC family)
MAERIKLHPETPHMKRIFEIADKVRQGDIMLFPTDSQYALGCAYDNKKGIERIRLIRHLDDDQHLTLILDSLSGISKFAYLSDDRFKIIKRLIPGPYTFILPATKEVPKLLVHPKKKTIGIRVPDYPINQRLIEELKAPLLAITAKKPEFNEDTLENLEREELLRKFEKQVDIIIDNQQDLPSHESTIINMTNDTNVMVRKGLGHEEAIETFAQQAIPLEIAE